MILVITYSSQKLLIPFGFRSDTCKWLLNDLICDLNYQFFFGVGMLFHLNLQTPRENCC
jgi:hypothetical protein